ncbi:MAG: hypothetical protein CMD96_05915 [Gammaproteobacteria bacterium]|nr:hypothetical protein [Gammaproteobacteria bacterium]|tara:strand:- start:4093 stop:4557 length:465 start_codon:yes stop_codon:yes gene_type:complete
MDKPVKINFAPKEIPIELLISYQQKKLSGTDIAKIVGCSDSNVRKRLAEAGYPIQKAKHFKEHEATIIGLKRKEILESISEGDKKKASLMQKVTSYGILFDKQRVLEDKSTENIAFSGRLEEIQDTKGKVLDILKRLRTPALSHNTPETSEDAL